MAQETAQMKNTLASAQRGDIESSEWFVHKGVPMVRISVAASELINTGNFSNVTIGPISVARFVPDSDVEALAQAIQETQSLCEVAVAEERQTVQALLRANASSQRS